MAKKNRDDMKGRIATSSLQNDKLHSAHLKAFLCFCLIIAFTAAFGVTLPDFKQRKTDDMEAIREIGYYLVASTEIDDSHQKAGLRHNRRSVRKLLNIADFSDPKAIREIGYYLVASTEIDDSQQKAGLRHNRRSERKLLNIADFSDPKSVVFKNRFQEPNSVQPQMQFSGTPSVSVGPQLQQEQLYPPSSVDQKPNDYFQGATASDSTEIHNLPQNDHQPMSQTPDNAFHGFPASAVDQSYTNGAKILEQGPMKYSQNIESGLALTQLAQQPQETSQGASITASGSSQGHFNVGITSNDTQAPPIQRQNQQPIIQQPVQYSQGTISSKVHETNEIKQYGKFLSGGTEKSYQSAPGWKGLDAQQLQIHDQKSDLQQPVKIPQSDTSQSSQKKVQHLQASLKDNIMYSQDTTASRFTQNHANVGDSAEVAETQSVQQLHQQTHMEGYSQRGIAFNNNHNTSNLNAILQVPLTQLTQKPAVQALIEHSQGYIDVNVSQHLQKQQQLPDIKTQMVETESFMGKQSPVNFELRGFRDTWDLPLQVNDLPVFWQIPRSGGRTVVDILGQCHRFVMATDAGIRDGHGQDKNLTVLHIAGDGGGGATSLVNVDTTTTLGLQRAKRLRLVQSEVARVIVVRSIFEANELFDELHRGRLFAIFRHPVDRTISMFNHMKYADWEPTYDPEIADMTLKQYAQSKHAESNWMTRALSGAETKNLTEEHLKSAMDIIRRKFLVGLLNRKEESMERFEKYFEWIYRVHPKNQEKCRVGLLAVGADSNVNPNKVDKPLPGTPTHQLLVALNELDIRLYKYVEALFDEQANFVKLKEDGFRLDGATCCKCNKEC